MKNGRALMAWAGAWRARHQASLLRGKRIGAAIAFGQQRRDAHRHLIGGAAPGDLLRHMLWPHRHVRFAKGDVDMRAPPEPPAATGRPDNLCPGDCHRRHRCARMPREPRRARFHRNHAKWRVGIHKAAFGKDKHPRAAAQQIAHRPHCRAVGLATANRNHSALAGQPAEDRPLEQLRFGEDAQLMGQAHANSKLIGDAEMVADEEYGACLWQALDASDLKPHLQRQHQARGRAN